MSLKQDILRLQREAEVHTANFALKWRPYASQKLVIMASTIFLALFGGNQSGKTWTGLHKVRYDTTGEYPEWWEGKRTIRGIEAWVCGDRYTSIRDGIQKKLFGGDLKNPGAEPYSGNPPLIHKGMILDYGSAPNGDGALGWVKVRHSSGGVSTITFKTYHQGIDGLASATIDLVHVDEECKFEVLQELCVRILVNKGQLICTLTPLKGRSAYYKFLTGLDSDIATIAFLDWKEATHLDETAKSMMARAFAGHASFSARQTGVAVPMTGMCFPYDFQSLLVNPITIPPSWPRIIGMDQGWMTPTTAVCIVQQPGTPYKYVLPPYAETQRKPHEHHSAIITQFGDVPCRIDWSANQANKDDGERIMDQFNLAAHGDGFQMRIAESFRKYQRAKTRNWLERWRAIDDEVRDGHLMFIRDENVLSLREGRASRTRQLIDQLEEMEWEEDGSSAKKRNDWHLFDGFGYGMVSIEDALPMNVPRPLGPPMQQNIQVPAAWQMPSATLS